MARQDLYNSIDTLTRELVKLNPTTRNLKKLIGEFNASSRRIKPRRPLTRWERWKRETLNYFTRREIAHIRPVVYRAKALQLLVNTEFSTNTDIQASFRTFFNAAIYYNVIKDQSVMPATSPAIAGVEAGSPSTAGPSAAAPPATPAPATAPATGSATKNEQDSLACAKSFLYMAKQEQKEAENFNRSALTQDNPTKIKSLKDAITMTEQAKNSLIEAQENLTLAASHIINTPRSTGEETALTNMIDEAALLEHNLTSFINEKKTECVEIELNPDYLDQLAILDITEYLQSSSWIPGSEHDKQRRVQVMFAIELIHSTDSISQKIDGLQLISNSIDRNPSHLKEVLITIMMHYPKLLPDLEQIKREEISPAADDRLPPTPEQPASLNATTLPDFLKSNGLKPPSQEAEDLVATHIAANRWPIAKRIYRFAVSFWWPTPKNEVIAQEVQPPNGVLSLTKDDIKTLNDIRGCFPGSTINPQTLTTSLEELLVTPPPGADLMREIKEIAQIIATATQTPEKIRISAALFSHLQSLGLNSSPGTTPGTTPGTNLGKILIDATMATLEEEAKLALDVNSTCFKFKTTPKIEQAVRDKSHPKTMEDLALKIETRFIQTELDTTSGKSIKTKLQAYEGDSLSKRGDQDTKPTGILNLHPRTEIYVSLLAIYRTIWSRAADDPLPKQDNPQNRVTKRRLGALFLIKDIVCELKKMPLRGSTGDLKPTIDQLITHIKTLESLKDLRTYDRRWVFKKNTAGINKEYRQGIQDIIDSAGRYLEHLLQQHCSAIPCRVHHILDQAGYLQLQDDSSYSQRKTYSQAYAILQKEIAITPTDAPQKELYIDMLQEAQQELQNKELEKVTPYDLNNKLASLLDKYSAETHPSLHRLRDLKKTAVPQAAAETAAEAAPPAASTNPFVTEEAAVSSAAPQAAANPQAAAEAAAEAVFIANDFLYAIQNIDQLNNGKTLLADSKKIKRDLAEGITLLITNPTAFDQYDEIIEALNDNAFITTFAVSDNKYIHALRQTLLSSEETIRTNESLRPFIDNVRTLQEPSSLPPPASSSSLHSTTSASSAATFFLLGQRKAGDSLGPVGLRTNDGTHGPA